MHRLARSVTLTLAVATLCAPALAAPARKDIDLVRRATATTSGVIVYDVSNPLDPRFVEYEPYDANGDRGPEGLEYVKAEDSPTGRPLLIVGNEVSGTATLYEVAKPGH